MTNHGEKEYYTDEVNADAEIVEVKARKLQKSGSSKIIAGVCGGISHYLEVNPIFLRILFSLSVFIAGWGLVAYVIAAFLLPQDASRYLSDKFTESKLKYFEIRSSIAILIIFIGIYWFLSDLGIFTYIRFFGLSFTVLLPFTLAAAGLSFLIKSTKLNRNSVEEYNIKFTRSATNKRLTGICGGLSEYLRIDSAALRTVSVFSLLLTGGLSGIVYLIMYISVPLEKEGISNAQ